MTLKEITESKGFKLTSAILSILCTVLVFYLCNQLTTAKQKNKELENLQKVTQERLTYFKDADGENRARISRFETEKTKDFLKFQTAEADVKFLQEKVAKYEKEIRKGGSVSVVETETTGKYYGTTEVTPTAEPNFPIYKSSFNKEGWIWGDILASKDSTVVTMNSRDRLTLVLGSEPTGFLGLGKGRPFADITNESPYSTTKNLRSYSVTPAKAKHWTIGAGATYGISFINGGHVGFGGAVGATVGYSFINF